MQGPVLRILEPPPSPTTVPNEGDKVATRGLPYTVGGHERPFDADKARCCLIAARDHCGQRYSRLDALPVIQLYRLEGPFVEAGESTVSQWEGTAL
jgi:hypothetical protein